MKFVFNPFTSNLDAVNTGTIGGSIGATQIAFGSGTNTITGTNNATLDSSGNGSFRGKVSVGDATNTGAATIRFTPQSGGEFRFAYLNSVSSYKPTGAGSDVWVLTSGAEPTGSGGYFPFWVDFGDQSLHSYGAGYFGNGGSSSYWQVGGSTISINPQGKKGLIFYNDGSGHQAYMGYDGGVFKFDNQDWASIWMSLNGESRFFQMSASGGHSHILQLQEDTFYSTHTYHGFGLSNPQFVLDVYGNNFGSGDSEGIAQISGESSSDNRTRIFLKNRNSPVNTSRSTVFHWLGSDNVGYGNIESKYEMGNDVYKDGTQTFYLYDSIRGGLDFLFDPNGGLTLYNNLSVAGNVNLGQNLNNVITNVSQIAQVGSVTAAGHDGPNYLVKAGNFGYSVDYACHLQIYDLTIPTNPKILGVYYPTYITGGSPGTCAVQGNYVYLFGNGNYMEVIDVTNKDAPVFFGYCTLTGASYYQGTAVAGSYVYTADNTGNLVVVDVSNPSSPKLANTISTGFVSGFYTLVSENNLFVSLYNGGSTYLNIYSLQNASSPSLVSSTFVESGSGPSLQVNSPYVYVPMYNTGDLVILNIGDLTAPYIVSTTHLGAYQTFCTLNGRYIFSTGYHDFWCMDVYDPTAPVGVAHLSYGGSVNGITSDGNYVYLVDNSAGDLYVIKFAGLEVAGINAGAIKTGRLEVDGPVYSQGVVTGGSGVAAGAGGVASVGPVATLNAMSAAMGYLLPDYTTISSPVEGQLAYNFSTHAQTYYNGSSWV